MLWYPRVSTQISEEAEYYQMAANILHMERSLTQTLARKLRISVCKVYDRHRQIVNTESGQTPVLQRSRGVRVVANGARSQSPMPTAPGLKAGGYCSHGRSQLTG